MGDSPQVSNMKISKHSRRISTLATLIIAVLIMAACSAPGEESEGPTLESCRLSGMVDAQCASIPVPENRAGADGQTIDIHFAVIAAESSIAEPDPVFMLAGGPGQSAIEVYPLVLEFFGALRQNRDIVLVDQRGTGESNALACPEVRELPLDSSDEQVEQTLEDCREELAQEADLTQYITDIAMQDLDEVREALGYEEINLVGGSYGTRAALRYMDLFPDRVRTAVLNAVVSEELVLQLQAPVDGQRALQLLFERCAQDPACSEAFPDFEATFQDVRAGLEGGREVTLRHPISGERVTLTLDQEDFMQGIFSLLYSPELVSLLPYMTDQIAETGDYGPLVAQMIALTADAISYQGMFYAVVCSEDAPLIDPQEAAEKRGDSPFPLVGEDLVEQCENWSRADVPPAFREEVTSDVPTLLLSGEADPITPPRYAEQVAEDLSNSRHIVLPGYGHDIMLAGCMPSVVTEFISAGAVEGLDTSCVEEITPPPFFVSATGPRP